MRRVQKIAVAKRRRRRTSTGADQVKRAAREERSQALSGIAAVMLGAWTARRRAA
jgi:hypothetical protein